MENISKKLSFNPLIPQLKKINNLTGIEEIEYDRVVKKLYVRFKKNSADIIIFYNIDQKIYDKILKSEIIINTKFKEKYHSSTL